MSGGFQINDQKRMYFLTFQVVNWVDIFTRKIYRDIVLDAFKYARENKNWLLYGYVIMSNHVHLLCRSESGELSNTIRDIKKYTSVQMIDAVRNASESRSSWMLKVFSDNAEKRRRNVKYQLWTHENHPILLKSNKFIKQKLNYIHQNPVKAGIVERPEDYLYSSARNYAGLSALIDVCLLKF